MIGKGKASKPTFLSLFSGCGGFDLGFVEAGFSCLGAFDLDPAAVETHSGHFDTPAQVCDLGEGVPTPSRFKNVDVLLAGAPCQGFSTIGKRDVDDPRNDLLLLGGRIASKLKPKVFVAENVSGVLSGGHRVYWESLRSILQNAGYQCFDLKCSADNFGVPQKRSRVIMLALRDARPISVELRMTKGETVEHALRNVAGLPNHSPKFLASNSAAEFIARHIKPGQKLSNVRSSDRAVHTWAIPEVFGRTNVRERQLLEAVVKLRRRNRRRDSGDADPVTSREVTKTLGWAAAPTLVKLQAKGYIRKVGRFYDLAHTFNGKYRRLDPQLPSPTVDTRFGDPRFYLHPFESRGLTVREAARIQGFPDNFIVTGSERAQYRQIGNAVPPPMAKVIGSFIKDAILNGERINGG